MNNSTEMRGALEALAVDAGTFAEGASEPEFKQFLYIESELYKIARIDRFLNLENPSVTQAVESAHASLLPLLVEVKEALRQADDSLGALRRGHGLHVSELCYPARNTVNDALAKLNAFLSL